MPSPIGHALAGLATAWASEPAPQPGTPARAPTRLAIVCCALAAAPDLDLLVPGAHRTVTHSVTAAIITTIVAAGVTGWVTRKTGQAGRAGQVGRAGRAGQVRRAERVGRVAHTWWGIALICGAAYGSHLLLDLLGADPNPPSGIQLLWPSQRWFISPITIFPGTERRHIFSRLSIETNLKAVAVECLVVGSLALIVKWTRRWGGQGR